MPLGGTLHRSEEPAVDKCSTLPSLEHTVRSHLSSGASESPDRVKAWLSSVVTSWRTGTGIGFIFFLPYFTLPMPHS